MSFSADRSISSIFKSLPFPVKLIIFFIVYFLSSKVGLFVEVEYGGVSSIWPPAGIALAVFLRSGLKYWPMIIAGEFCIALSLGQPPLAGLIGGTAQLLEAVTAFYLIKSKKIEKITSSPHATIWFTLLGAIIPPFLASLIGATSLKGLGLLSQTEFFPALITWWLGDAIGIMVLTPFLNDFRGFSFPSRTSFYTFCALMAGAVITCLPMSLAANEVNTYFYFILLPFVVVSAFYFKLPGAGCATVILTVLVFLKLPGMGQNDLVTAIRMTFAGTCGFTGYLVTALMEKREQDQRTIQRQNDYLNALQEVIIGLIQQLDPKQLLQTIVQRACELIQTDSGYFCQNEPGSEIIMVNVGRGIYGDLIGYQVSPGQGVAGRVWQSRQPLMINNYQHSELRHPDKIWDKVSAIIGVPIHLGNEAVGVLGVLSSEPGREFTQDDLDIIQQFAELASVAWQNAAIHTNLSRQLEARQQAEKALAISEQTHREIFNSTSDGMLVLDVETGQILQSNQAAKHIFFHAEDNGRADLQQLLQTGDVKTANKDWLQHCLHAGPQTFEWCGKTILKEKSWYEITLKGTQIQGRQRILAVLRCIDERKEAEASLRQLQTAIENTDEDVMITDAEGKILYVNPAFEKHTGYKRTEVISRSPGILKSGAHDRDFYRRMWDTILAGDIWRGQLKNRRKDGTHILQEASIAPFKDNENRIVGFVSVKWDITEHEKIKMELEQAKKLEAIGTMASGIAHDFNNILAAIMGHAELALLYNLPADHPAADNCGEILKAGRRGADLVKQILIFSQSSEIELHRIDILPIVKEICKSIQGTLPQTISLQLRIEATQTQILATPALIHQVLLNLLTNARQALENDTGTVILRVFNQQAATAAPAPGISLYESNEYLTLEVTDNGVGMEQATISKIFEPYFTTKGTGRGTGLGLSVVHGIIKQLSGNIKVESAPGEGSTFTVNFPVNTGIEQAEPLKEETLVGGSESILFVDDNEVLADIADQMLSRQGYRVKTFYDSSEAAEHFKTASKDYDLIITDLVMPEMSGLELSQVIRESAPTIPIILCTGDPTALDKEKIEKIGITRIATKPFILSKMTRNIREALDQ